MKFGLAIDHVLLAPEDLAHIGTYRPSQCVEMRAFRAVWAIRALHSSFFDGMQATAKHEPPTQRRSTTAATFLPERPRCDASCFPPCPQPRITTSNFSIAEVLVVSVSSANRTSVTIARTRLGVIPATPWALTAYCMCFDKKPAIAEPISAPWVSSAKWPVSNN